ncbi:MAG: hypothetical protein OEY05_13825 [Paracoccaceae bacterium]|nr:hypothetical protein [Paracoccaceae bacterium]
MKNSDRTQATTISSAHKGDDRQTWPPPSNCKSAPRLQMKRPNRTLVSFATPHMTIGHELNASLT